MYVKTYHLPQQSNHTPLSARYDKPQSVASAKSQFRPHTTLPTPKTESQVLQTRSQSVIQAPKKPAEKEDFYHMSMDLDAMK